MKKKVELVIVVDGAECYYKLPDMDDGIPDDMHVYHGLEATVDAIRRTSDLLEGALKSSVLRIMLVNAEMMSRAGAVDSPIEVVTDENGQPGIKNPKSGEVKWL